MIHIDSSRLTRPTNFNEDCTVPGLRWIAEHPKAQRLGKKRPRDFWTPFKPQLSDAFRELCAYGAMYEPVGTVDHFIPVDADESLAYDWDNYRFASGWINSGKKNREGFLDPLRVQDGWFEVLLPSLQLIPTDRIPVDLRPLAEATITRLHLRDDERVLRQRRRWYRLFQEGKLDLAGLRENAPLIAAAIDKQNSVAQFHGNQD